MTLTKQTEKRLKRPFILQLRVFLLTFFPTGSVSLAESQVKQLIYTIRKNFENAVNGYCGSCSKIYFRTSKGAFVQGYRLSIMANGTPIEICALPSDFIEKEESGEPLPR